MLFAIQRSRQLFIFRALLKKEERLVNFHKLYNNLPRNNNLTLTSIYLITISRLIYNAELANQILDTTAENINRAIKRVARSLQKRLVVYNIATQIER